MTSSHWLFGSLILLVLAFTVSCASVSPTVYRQDMLLQIDRWRIDFTYEPGRLERKAEATGGTEVKMITEGRSPRDLQLRDDIFYRLQDKHGIKMTRASDTSVGEIRIHPVHFYSGGFKSLDVTMVAPNGETVVKGRGTLLKIITLQKGMTL